MPPLQPRTWTTDSVKNVLESVAIVVAGIWALYTFWCQSVHIPSEREVHLDIIGELNPIGPFQPRPTAPTAAKTAAAPNRFRALRAKVTFRNTGSRVVKTVDSWYRLDAYKIADALNGPTADSENFRQAVNQHFNAALQTIVDVPGITRYTYREREPEIIAAGLIQSRSYWYDINEQSQSEYLFMVPEQYDAVSLELAADITPDDKYITGAQIQMNDHGVIDSSPQRSKTCSLCFWRSPSPVYQIRTTVEAPAWELNAGQAGTGH